MSEFCLKGVQYDCERRTQALHEAISVSFSIHLMLASCITGNHLGTDTSYHSDLSMTHQLRGYHTWAQKP